MSEELYDWLKREWIFSNIKKYHKYFKMWINNITESQIEGFTKQMLSQKADILSCHRWDILSKIDINKYDNM